MSRKAINRALKLLGYEIRKVQPTSMRERRSTSVQSPPPMEAIWPLPRGSNRPSKEEIQAEFAKHDSWHYTYAFEGGISISVDRDHSGAGVERHLQRYRHFMPYLIHAQNGSLEGKRVLDIACNSGFWSMQCALLGAEVVGFDARAELIEQANFIKSIVGINNVEFTVLDFWEMSSQSLGGAFDIVLNLGILYHLAEPLEALKLTTRMARSNILLDTAVYPAEGSLVRLQWEEPTDIRSANNAGIVAYPSKSSVELMLRHLGVANWFEIPIQDHNLPNDYLNHRRATWLIEV